MAFTNCCSTAPSTVQKKERKKRATVKDSEVFCANPPRHTHKKNLFKVYKIQISQFQTKPSSLKSVAFAHKHTKIMVHTGVVVVLTVLVIQFSEKLIEVVLVRNPFVL